MVSGALAQLEFLAFHRPRADAPSDTPAVIPGAESGLLVTKSNRTPAPVPSGVTDG